MKLTAFHKEHLKGIAKKLPVVLTDTHEKHIVKGKDILEWGTVTEIDGMPVDPERDYLWHYPVQMYHNHYRRLKRVFRRTGIDGVCEYLKNISNIIAANNNGKAMNAFVQLQTFINQAV